MPFNEIWRETKNVWTYKEKGKNLMSVLLTTKNMLIFLLQIINNVVNNTVLKLEFEKQWCDVYVFYLPFTLGVVMWMELS